MVQTTENAANQIMDACDVLRTATRKAGGSAAITSTAFEKARRSVARMLNRVGIVLTEYDHAFEELFVTGSGPHRFITFLKDASQHFQTCGAGLGLLQHTCETWDSSTRSFPDRHANAETITTVLQTILDIVPTDS